MDIYLSNHFMLIIDDDFIWYKIPIRNFKIDDMYIVDYNYDMDLVNLVIVNQTEYGKRVIKARIKHKQLEISSLKNGIIKNQVDAFAYSKNYSMFFLTIDSFFGNLLIHHVFLADQSENYYTVENQTKIISVLVNEDILLITTLNDYYQ